MQLNRRVTTGLGVMAVVLLAGQAWAASSISYSIELGGNNFASQLHAGNKVAYQRGSSAAGQSFYHGTPINYAIVATAGGVQGSGLGAGSPIYGAANLVWSLELRNEAGQLVTGATFKSTVNDGSNGEQPRAAAFPYSFKLPSVATPGRLIDPYATGGPGMLVYSYPYFAPGSGKLVGMGAGYRQWAKTSYYTWTTAGVGMDATPDGAVKLGIVPVAEGQIDMSSLPLGTYTLTVIPEPGNNVLRGDLIPNLNATQNRPAFATAAEQVGGSQITFTLNDTPVCEGGIVGRYVFYNNSYWDNKTLAITEDDFAAIATDKEALLPGQTSSFKNYINYSKSINGIIVDACKWSRVPVVGEDIFFFVGNSNNGWNIANVEAPAPNDMKVFPGKGGVKGNADRLVITWANNAIPNASWLMVYIPSNSELGLTADDIFVFGILKGDGNGDGLADATDKDGVKANTSMLIPVLITNPWDFNRDGYVDSSDAVVVTNNPIGPGQGLKQITSW